MSLHTITFGGSVAAAPGGTGPAVNNPSLNNIQDDDSYLVTLGFTGSITAPGTYPLPGASLVFSDLNESASESSFSSVSLSVVTDGAYYDLSLLGCLSTGSGCLMGTRCRQTFRSRLPISTQPTSVRRAFHLSIHLWTF